MWRRVVVCVLGVGCSTARFAGNTYTDDHVAYRVGPLGSDWRRTSVGGANVAFVNPSGGTIVVNSTCAGIKDLPLQVLTNQELFGVEGQREEARELLTLDGRAALRTRVSGVLDGVPVTMELIVLKKDACTYDFALIAGHDVFDAREPDFWALVSGFHAERRG